MGGLSIESMTIHIAVCSRNADECGQSIQAIRLASVKGGISIRIYRYDTADALYRDIIAKAVRIHILYLDMDIAERNGIETAKLLRTAGFRGRIILQGDSADRVQEAFDVSAFHFIIKGECSKRKFDEIFYRAVQQAETEAGVQIKLSFGSSDLCIPLADIWYFRMKGRHIEAYFKGGTFLFNSAVKKLSHGLTEFDFVQISRTSVVNLAAIREGHRREVILNDGTVLMIGDSYAERFRLLYRNWTGGERNVLVTMSGQITKNK